MVQLTSMPFLLSTRLMQGAVTEIKKNFQTAQYEAVTGRVADISEALDGDIGRAHQIEKQLRLAERRGEALKATSTEFELVQTVLGSASQKAADLSVEVAGALGLDDNTALAAHASTARAELESVFGQLNTSFGGKYLFSGAAVETPPLADVETLIDHVQAMIVGAPDPASVEAELDIYFGAGGVFETSIYQGSTTDGPAREVAAGRRIGVDVTPLDQGLRDVIRGLAVLATARDSASSEYFSDTLMETSGQLLGAASQRILSDQTRLGSTEEELALLLTRNEAARFAYDQSVSSLLGRDQYDAATRMTSIETQLEAAYLSTSRIANLSLVNYLR